MARFRPGLPGTERVGGELEDESLALAARGIEGAHDIDRRGHMNGTCAGLVEPPGGHALEGGQLRLRGRAGFQTPQYCVTPLVGKIDRQRREGR